MKLIQVISTHKKKATKGMVEAIVKLKDGRIVTRHIYPGDAAKEVAPEVQHPEQEQS
jgi:hypothetical protein